MGRRSYSPLCCRRMGGQRNRRRKTGLGRSTYGRTCPIRCIQSSSVFPMVRQTIRNICRCRSMPTFRTSERTFLRRDGYDTDTPCRIKDRSLPVSSSHQPVGRWNFPHLRKLHRHGAYHSKKLVYPASRMGMVLQTAPPGI